MSAEPIEPEAAPWQPDPMRQSLANYTLQDLLNLPQDAPRVELVNGVIHVVPSATAGHQTTASLLWNWFYRQAPEAYMPFENLGVALSADHSRQPDVVLCHHTIDDDTSLVMPHDVVLAIEVVSPSTRSTDRFAKPGEYAAAGIPSYWRIEQNPLHIYVYQLAAPTDREYRLVADSDSLIEVDEPFRISLPLGEITPRRKR